jgi:FAD:protein FMN transferase
VSPAAPTYRRAVPLMGTVASIVIRGVIDPEAVDDAFAEMRRIESVFSTFIPDSPISRLGRGEIRLSQVPWEVRQVLNACESLASGTMGHFQHRRPGPNQTLLDPSAYVKGWAGDRAATVLRNGGAGSFSINVGGDVLSAGGTPQRPWDIGIRHPDDPLQVGAVLSILDGAVATSGSYERGNHVWGSDGTMQSVTVTGPELALADALSTAIFAGGVDDLGWMANYQGYEVMVIANDRVHWTSGLEDFISGRLRVG